MRLFWVSVLVFVATVAVMITPVMADNTEQGGNGIFIDMDEMTTIQGTVVENPDQPVHRRRSLSSRGGSIVSTARKYIGTPYRWGGTSGAGFDCSGFVMTMFNQNGVKLRRMADEQYYKGNKVQRDDLEAGDLVFFSTYGPGVTHVGIYVGNDQFIHASSSRGVTISSLNDNYYRNRFIGGCRY